MTDQTPAGATGLLATPKAHQLLARIAEILQRPPAREAVDGGDDRDGQR